MVKAVLVMDMPERCIDCPCECDGYCQAEGAVKGIVESMKAKPSWCPLQPMPETQSSLNGVSDAWKEGWNACINAICGLDVLSKKKE